MKNLKKFTMLLNLFGENDGGDQDTDNPNNDKQPFAVFDDESSFMTRVKRESTKVINGLFEELGIKNKDELKNIITQKKEEEEKNQTEFEKIKLQLDNKNQEYDMINSKLQKIELEKAAIKIAKEIGLDYDKSIYALRLADYTNIPLLDGKLDSDEVKSRLEKTVEDFKDIFGVGGDKKEKPPKKGSYSFGANKPAGLTMDIIKTMSAEQIADRIDEVNEVIKNSK